MSLGTTEESLALSSYSPIRYLLYINQIPLSLFFSRLNNPSSQRLYSYQMLQAFDYLHGRSLDLLQYFQVSLVLGSLESDPRLSSTE